SCLLMFTASPQCLTPMGSDIRIVLQRICMLEVSHRTLCIPLPIPHPTEAVEHSWTIGRRRQCLVNQSFGTTEIATVMSQRVSQSIHQYGIFRTILQQPLEYVDGLLHPTRTLQNDRALVFDGGMAGMLLECSSEKLQAPFRITVIGE